MNCGESARVGNVSKGCRFITQNKVRVYENSLKMENC